MVILVVVALSCGRVFKVESDAVESAEEAETLETTDDTILRSTAEQLV